VEEVGSYIMKQDEPRAEDDLNLSQNEDSNEDSEVDKLMERIRKQREALDDMLTKDKKETGGSTEIKKEEQNSEITEDTNEKPSIEKTKSQNIEAEQPEGRTSALYHANTLLASKHRLSKLIEFSSTYIEMLNYLLQCFIPPLSFHTTVQND
jgi:flagellar biosynthesis GTPase FlhF